MSFHEYLLCVLSVDGERNKSKPRRLTLSLPSANFFSPSLSRSVVNSISFFMKMVTSTNDAPSLWYLLMLLLKIFTVYFSFSIFFSIWRNFPFRMSGSVLMHGRWKLICFWICCFFFCFPSRRKIVLKTSWIFTQNSFYAEITGKKIPMRVLCWLAEGENTFKSLMMRIQKAYFIDFKWWWKSSKVSKYWSLQLQTDNHSYSHSRNLPNYTQLINNQYPHMTFMANATIFGQLKLLCRHVFLRLKKLILLISTDPIIWRICV